MAGFADLIPKSQPAYYGAGVSGAGTAGADWVWEFIDAKDDSGDLIDFTDTTGTCRVFQNVGEPVVAELNFEGFMGGFRVSAPAPATADYPIGHFDWALEVTDGTNVVQVWGPTNSRFQIRTGA